MKDKSSPPRSKDEVAQAAFLLTWIVLVIAASVLLGHRLFASKVDLARLAASAPFYSSHHLSSFITALVPPYDSRAQKLAHTTVLLTLSCLAMFGALRARAAEAMVGVGVRGFPLWKIGAILLACLLALNLVPAWWIGARPFLRNSATYVAAGIAVVVLHLLHQRRRSFTQAASGAVVLLSLAVITLPGIWRPMDLSSFDTETITIIESHYSMILGTGRLIAAGKPLFVSTRPYYGILMPLFTVLMERHGYLETIGQWFQYIRATQALFLVVVLVSLFRYSKARWAYCLIPCALIFPWYHFAHRAVLFPNQSGFRLLGPALTTLIVTFLSWKTSSRRAAFVLGLGSGIACLANVETGIPCTIGALMFLWVRSVGQASSVRLRVSMCGSFILAGLLSGLAWILAVRVALGYWLLNVPSAVASYLGVIRLFLEMNLGGMRLSRDIWPIVMFGHAIFVLLALLLRRGPPSRSDPVRAYAATVIVVWFSYYANRPHPWNLSGFYMFYAFLVIDLIRVVRVAALRKSITASAAFAAIVFFLGVIPEAVQIERASGLRGALFSAKPATALVSGVYFPPTFGRELVERSAFIRAHGSRERIIYLTGDSFFVPVMSGAVSDMPYLDAANESFIEADYTRLLARLTNYQTSTIYIDSPESATGRDGIFHRFYQYATAQLSPTFQRREVSHGWWVLRRSGREATEQDARFSP